MGSKQQQRSILLRCGITGAVTYVILILLLIMSPVLLMMRSSQAISISHWTWGSQEEPGVSFSLNSVGPSSSLDGSFKFAIADMFSCSSSPPGSTSSSSSLTATAADWEIIMAAVLAEIRDWREVYSSSASSALGSQVLNDDIVEGLVNFDRLVSNASAALLAAGSSTSSSSSSSVALEVPWTKTLLATASAFIPDDSSTRTSNILSTDRWRIFWSPFSTSSSSSTFTDFGGAFASILGDFSNVSSGGSNQQITEGLSTVISLENELLSQFKTLYAVDGEGTRLVINLPGSSNSGGSSDNDSGNLVNQLVLAPANLLTQTAGSSSSSTNGEGILILKSKEVLNGAVSAQQGDCFKPSSRNVGRFLGLGIGISFVLIPIIALVCVIVVVVMRSQRAGDKGGVERKRNLNRGSFGDESGSSPRALDSDHRSQESGDYEGGEGKKKKVKGSDDDGQGLFDDDDDDGDIPDDAFDAQRDDNSSEGMGGREAEEMGGDEDFASAHFVPNRKRKNNNAFGELQQEESSSTFHMSDASMMQGSRAGGGGTYAGESSAGTQNSSSGAAGANARAIRGGVSSSKGSGSGGKKPGDAAADEKTTFQIQSSNRLREMNTIVGFTESVGSVAHILYDNFERLSTSDPFEAERISGDFLGDLASIAKTLDGSVVSFSSHSLIVAWNALIPKVAHQMAAVRFLETVRQRIKGSKILVSLLTGKLFTTRNVKPPLVVGPAVDRAASLAQLQELSGQMTVLSEGIVFAMPDQGRGKVTPIDLVVFRGEEQTTMLYTVSNTANVGDDAQKQRKENEAILLKQLYSCLSTSQWYKALTLVDDVKDPVQKAQLRTITNFCISAAGSERVLLSDGYSRAELLWKFPAEFYSATVGSGSGQGGADGAGAVGGGKGGGTAMARRMRGLSRALIGRTGSFSAPLSDGTGGGGPTTSSSLLSASKVSAHLYTSTAKTEGMTSTVITNLTAHSIGDSSGIPGASMASVGGGKIHSVTSEYAFLPVKFTDNKKKMWRIAQSKVVGRKGNVKVFLGASDDGLPCAIRTIDIRNATDDEWQLEINANVTAACCKHRHSAEVYSVTKYNDKFLLAVSEYIPGGKLNHLLNEFGGLMLEPARRFAKELLEVVRYLQRNRIVHGSIMPSSVLMSMDGAVKLKSFYYSVTLVNSGGVGGGTSLSHPPHRHSSMDASFNASSSTNLLQSSSNNMNVGTDIIEVMKRTVAHDENKVRLLAPEIVAAILPEIQQAVAIEQQQQQATHRAGGTSSQKSASISTQQQMMSITDPQTGGATRGGGGGQTPSEADSSTIQEPVEQTTSGAPLLAEGGGAGGLLALSVPSSSTAVVVEEPTTSSTSPPAPVVVNGGAGGGAFGMFEIVEAGPVLGAPMSVTSLNSNDPTGVRNQFKTELNKSKDSAKELLASGEKAGHHFNTDIYGYAVTVLAMLVGRLPQVIPTSKEDLGSLLMTEAPCVAALPSDQQRKDLVQTFTRFLLPCFATKPSKRPTAEQLVLDRFFM